MELTGPDDTRVRYDEGEAPRACDLVDLVVDGGHLEVGVQRVLVFCTKG